MARHQGGDEEMSAVGWISVADVFVLLTVLLLSICLSFVRPTSSQSAATSSNQNWIVAVEKERAEHAAKLAAAEQERAALVVQMKSNQATAATQTNDLDGARKAATAQARRAIASEAQLTALRNNDSLLAKQVDSLRLQLSESQTQAARAQDMIRGWMAWGERIRADLKTVTMQRDDAIAKASVTRESEGRFRQELLGFKGALNRVVFVVDRSDSMNANGRWEDVRQTALTWLENLPVKQAALVVFNRQVYAFPTDGTLRDMSRQEDRAALIEELSHLKPSGATNTYAAIEQALSYPEIDAVILFADGSPSAGPDVNGSYSAAVRAMVARKRAQGQKARLHTVAVGDYFKPDVGRFLQTLARETDGTFIGR